MRSVLTSLMTSSALLWGTTGAAEDEKFSGPQPGERITPFKVLRVTGPFDAEEVVAASEKESGPTLIVFVHEITEPAIGLMIWMEWYASKLEGLTSHLVLLAEDRGKAEETAKRWAARPFFARSPVSISLDGREGPGKYGLNRNVAMTVLVAKDHKVVANFALVAPNDTDAPKVLAAIAKLMDQPAPSLQKIQAEVRAERDRRRQDRLRENPLYKLAPDPALGKLMVQLVQGEDRSEEAAKEIAEAIAKWAGDKPEKKKALADYCKTVLEKYECSRYAKEALTKLSED